MRVCVIGNSHTACIKLAWDNWGREQFKNSELTFYATRGARIGTLYAKDGALHSDEEEVRKNLGISSCGRTNVVLDEYDVCVLVGATPRLEEFVAGAVRQSRFYSEAVLERAWRCPMDKSLAKKLLNEIRKLSAIPVVALAKPNLAGEKDCKEIDRDAVERAGELMHEKCLALGADLLLQPDRTVRDLIYTDPGFARGSRRLIRSGNERGEQDFGEDDVTHMNESFGRECLNEFMAMHASS